ncbi:TlpA family protein disulfide reductase [Pelagicoccus sp. NFK12]|uniref:TlpA family protein disulfide reductase n=1 Tax=Pelagicoccus enzymogenes TaxID=2773457 RepID=A0A927FA57_9BACT|nr:TlpA disulfide reductase family protein [Pelagicoccus enzymogenes]MBD5781322.1 TlpA family protein disulfide reductase [Pelagicoccus enzymogenes]MDQ8199582.1 TlpA disulfide reductase family protein [Pelagicoccus enzymogenes]
MKKALPSLLLVVALVGFAYWQNKPRPANDADLFVGKPGPAFEVAEWISEPPQREGKYLLIDFWATWCGPCIRAIPHMNELHATYQDRLTVVGVSRESRQKVESMKSPRMEYYSAIDPQDRMADFFQIRSIPQVALMDPNGIVLYKGHPAYLTEEKLEELLSAN